jgi:hypothetical protein
LRWHLERGVSVYFCEWRYGFLSCRVICKSESDLTNTVPSNQALIYKAAVQKSCKELRWRAIIGQLLPLIVATAWSSVRLLYIHYLPDGLTAIAATQLLPSERQSLEAEQTSPRLQNPGRFTYPPHAPSNCAPVPHWMQRPCYRHGTPVDTPLPEFITAGPVQYPAPVRLGIQAAGSAVRRSFAMAHRS